jgi:signal transduction histidine kinase
VVFSSGLVYGGVRLARSSLDARRLWWAGLWTLIGLAGLVALVTLLTALQMAQGRQPPDEPIVQALLVAAGGGGVAGLLIGVSTAREAAEAERARRQRDALVFVNELLRHNVLNGMQLIKGNVQILEEHVDGEGYRYVETTQDRSDSIVELVQNVRVLVDSISRAVSLQAVDVRRCLTRVVADARETYPDASFTVDLPGDARAQADELLEAVFENLVANAVEHNDGDDPRVHVSATVERNTIRVTVADDGPGIPEARREACFEPGEQDASSVGQGLGLYLVATLVERYDGTVRVEDADLGGAAVVVELPRADA